MSISSALSSAFSGLSTGARLAEVASGNIANALTEGYARREAEVASRLSGGIGIGPRVVSVERAIDMALVRDLRLADAASANLQPRLDFIRKLEAAYGEPTQAASLSARLAQLERALAEAAGRPESDARLQATLEAASRLTEGVNAASEVITEARQGADRAIARDVDILNATLKSVRELNMQITRMSARGEDTSAALDERQKLIGRIADIVPLREVARDGQQVALFTTTGIALLDGRAARFDFTPSPGVGPDRSLAGGGPSALFVDGKPLSANPNGGRLGEGRLAALFELRDVIAPQAQNDLDALARDLIERFSGPEVDSTLAPGEAGLFVDQGAPATALTDAGIAARLSLNSRADPAQGGAIWRLRDGMQATTSQPLADPARLQAMSDRLSATRTLAGSSVSAAGSLADQLAQVTATVSTARVSAESEASFAAARTEALKAELLRNGVDTDQEMQDLMLIEQAYAANARVIQTVDDMLRTILEI